MTTPKINRYSAPDDFRATTSATTAMQRTPLGKWVRWSDWEELQAQHDQLKKEGTPGVMHKVDQAFYNLTIKERDYERIRFDSLESKNHQLRADLGEALGKIIGLKRDGLKWAKEDGRMEALKECLEIIRPHHAISDHGSLYQIAGSIQSLIDQAPPVTKEAADDNAA